MTDTQHDENAPETPENATTDPEQPEAPQEPQEAPERGSREAAKYRRQLRDVEAERDRLISERDAARRTILEAHLQNYRLKFENPDGSTQEHSFNAGAASEVPLDVFDDSGKLDGEKLQNVMRTLQEEKPYLFKHEVTRGIPIPDAMAKKFNDAIKPRDNFEKAFSPRP
jgi:hypothetical protein